MKTQLQKIHDLCPFLEPMFLYLAATISGYFHQGSYESISQSQWYDSVLWIDIGIVFATLFYIGFLGTHSNAYKKKKEAGDVSNKTRNSHTTQERKRLKLKLSFFEYEREKSIIIEDLNQVTSKSSD